MYNKVTFLDDEPEREWRLEYDSGTNIYKPTPWVRYENSGKWKTVTFYISDIYLRNEQKANMDFRIYNGGEYDVTVNFVRIIKAD